MLECRDAKNCQHLPIIRSLGFTNELVYAETPDWLIGRLRNAAIQRAEFDIPGPQENRGEGPASSGGVSRSGQPGPLDDGHAQPDRAFAHDETQCQGGESEAPPPRESALGSQGESPSREASEVPARTMLPAIDDGSRELASEETSSTHTEPMSPVQVLTAVASRARLFRSNDGRFFAQVQVGDRFEVFGLKSAGFRDWLIHGFLVYQPVPPTQVAIRSAVGMLEARARFDADIPEVFIRTGTRRRRPGLDVFPRPG